MRLQIVVWLLACSFGCVHRATSDEPLVPVVQPIPLVKEQSVKGNDQTLRLASPESLVQAVTAVLGSDNEAELTLKKPVSVTGPSGGITVKSGTKVAYRLTDGELQFDFTGDVKPTIEASVFGLPVKPDPRLVAVILKPDGHGVATADVLGIRRSRPFTLKWGDDQKLGATPTAKPVVWLYTATWCDACKQQKALLQRAGPLPFSLREVDVTNGGQPAWVKSLPKFHWNDSSGKSWASSSAAAVLSDFAPQRPQSATSTGPRWTFSGGDTKPNLIEHLLNDGIHRGKFTRSKLLESSREELVQLHSDDHNQSEKRKR